MILISIFSIISLIEYSTFMNNFGMAALQRIYPVDSAAAGISTVWTSIIYTIMPTKVVHERRIFNK